MGYVEIDHIWQYTLRYPCGSAGKESACNAGDLGSIPRLGRFPRERKGYPLQYCGLENSMDCIVQGVAKSQTQLSNFHFTSLHYMVRNMKQIMKNFKIQSITCHS